MIGGRIGDIWHRSPQPLQNSGEANVTKRVEVKIFVARWLLFHFILSSKEETSRGVRALPKHHSWDSLSALTHVCSRSSNLQQGIRVPVFMSWEQNLPHPRNILLFLKMSEPHNATLQTGEHQAQKKCLLPKFFLSPPQSGSSIAMVECRHQRIA